MREHWLMRWPWDVEKVLFSYKDVTVSFIMWLLSSDREHGSCVLFALCFRSAFFAQGLIVIIGGCNSSVMENWVECEDMELGGQVDVSPCFSVSVLHSPFIERGGELSPGGEKGLSLQHVTNPWLWQMRKADNTSMPVLTSFSSFLSYGIFVTQNWLLSSRKVYVCVEFGTGNFLQQQKGLLSEGHDDLNLGSSSVNNPEAKGITWCIITTWIFCSTVLTVRGKQIRQYVHAFYQGWSTNVNKVSF